MITGKPVAIAKIIGKDKPLGSESVIGINIPKYRTPLYGQNANENKIPIINEDNHPTWFVLFWNISESRPKEGNLNLMRSNKKIPISSSNGPKNFSPLLCKKLATSNLLTPRNSINATPK